MALKSLYISSWVFFVFGLSQVLPMRTKCHLHGNLLKRSHALLKDTGGRFPSKCIRERVQITFPESVFRSAKNTEETGVKLAIYETLNNTFSLFGNGDLPEEYDSAKLDAFQHVTFRLVEMSRCMMGIEVKSEKARIDIAARKELLRQYFEKMATVLQQKSFSFCAWEIVRNQIIRTLRFILDHASDTLFWLNRT
ncbi:interferon alpha-1-like isoform X2 [Brienomyrus brachyistius]|uniref:interferon alpha-1-like isoform X2 n=1 Tax=Brienomyrus brachyistius TaxID=42636 RepID=UPI0020B2EC6B|nr:interferon alpha-1-like isoform X2 [Brienomyrus brachyistius]